MLSDPSKRETYNLDQEAQRKAQVGRGSAGRAGNRGDERRSSTGTQRRKYTSEDSDSGDEKYFRRAEERLAAKRREEEYREILRREREEEEKRSSQRGLGGHWVKPLEARSSQKWDGWTKSGPRGEKGRESDGDSDVSSVLSFNIGINLNDLNLDDLRPMDEDEDPMLRGGEVWTIGGRREETAAPAPAPASNDPAGSHVDGAERGATGHKGSAAEGTSPLAKNPKCCSLQ